MEIPISMKMLIKENLKVGKNKIRISIRKNAPSNIAIEIKRDCLRFEVERKWILSDIWHDFNARNVIKTSVVNYTVNPNKEITHLHNLTGI